MSIFHTPQYAEDWSFLIGAIPGNKSLPTNVDGMTYHIVERRSRFLFIEVKRGSESMSDGQKFMLQALARVPAFTVVLLNSRVAKPDEMNGRAVIPFCFQYMGADGELSNPPDMTTPEDFRLRYAKWFRGEGF